MKRVLVTGGTGTLGAPLVRALCAANFDVTANFCSNIERATTLADETGCALHRADVSDENEVEVLFSNFSFDAIVHCAGRASDALLLRTSSALWQETMRAHLLSSFLITRASLQTLPHGGTLLLVASRVGERGFVGQSAYAAAKAGVLGLMKSAAQEGRARNLRINAICPGYAPGAEVLSETQKANREHQNAIPGADARESFAAFVAWFLTTNPPLSGHVLRPDCRIG